MSRSYLSKRQVEFERDSLDYLKEKHKKLIDYQNSIYKLWNVNNCHFNGTGCTLCQSIRNIVDDDVSWSIHDLNRRNKKVKRLELELSKKRQVKRSTKKRRREEKRNG